MAENASTVDRDASLLALLAVGETRSEAIAEAMGVPVRTVRFWLSGLRDQGLVEMPSRGTWRITRAGRRAVLAASIPEPVASLDAIAELPAEHRAMLRLVEDAVIARRALAEFYPGNWPGFVLLGPTKIGKTLVANLAARRVGSDPGEVVRLLMLETPGSLLGRRVQTGAETWSTTPSPFLALPLVVLDEYDKASPELRQAAFGYLAGASRYRSEDAVLTVNATAIITLNTEDDPSRLLPDSYLRRAVVLDTTPLVAVTRDVDEIARLLSRASLPSIDPDVVPPASALSEEARRGLRLILQSCLTGRGWGLVDVEAISRLALGRWAAMPHDPEAAVLGVATDYLLVSSTRPGLVQADWPARLEAVVGRTDSPIAETLAITRARQAAVGEREETAVRAQLDASLALAGTRERLREALDHGLRSVARGHELTDVDRATIATARGKARPLRDAIGTARSLDALEELESRLDQEVLVPLNSVANVVDARRRAASEQRRAELDRRRREVDRRVGERVQARAAQQAAKRRYADLQALYRCTTTRPGEDVLTDLIAVGCVVQHSEQYQEETIVSMANRSWVGRKLRTLRGNGAAASSAPSQPWDPREPWTQSQPPPATTEPEPRYVTRTRTWYEDRDGRRHDPGELVAWGSEEVCAVLQAAVAAEELPRLTRPATRRTMPRPRPR
jgi:DNA-binding transcriptional ArsR family regulator